MQPQHSLLRTILFRGNKKSTANLPRYSPYCTCNWLPFHRPCSFASQPFDCFARSIFPLFVLFNRLYSTLCIFGCQPPDLYSSPYFLRFSDDFLRNLTKIFSGQCAMQKGFHLIPGRNRRNTAPLSDAQACHCISRYRTVFQLIPGHLLQLLLIGKETA